MNIGGFFARIVNSRSQEVYFLGGFYRSGAEVSKQKSGGWPVHPPLPQEVSAVRLPTTIPC